MLPEADQLFKLAAVDLDFARPWFRNGSSESATIGSFLTTSRASAGYADNTAGIWIGFGNNAPRQTDKGLLVEEARTNGIRNNSMQGAVAGSPGTLPTNWAQNIGAGITRTIVGIGTSLGIDYIDVRYQGTLSSGTGAALFFDGSTIIAATNGQTWSLSAFIALVGGNLSGITIVGLGWNENNSSGTFQAGHSQTTFQSSLTSTLQRFSYVTANVNVNCAYVMPYVQIGAPTSSVVDITLRIGWPQIEQGGWATSPIRTISAAATRAADVITLTVPPTFGSAFSAAGIGTPQAPNSYASQQYLCQIDAGNNNNRMALLRINTTGNAYGYINSGGLALLSNQPAVWGQNVSGMLAVAGASGDYAVSFNASTPGTSFTAGTMPAPSIVRIGSALSGTTPWNGFISRIAIWPTARVANADLQKVTGGQTGAITPGAWVLDTRAPLDNGLFALDGVGDPQVISGSAVLAELEAYQLYSGPVATLRYGSDGYNDPTAPGYYEGRMTQPLSFRRDIFAGNTTTGASRVSFGELRLANDDGGLDGLRTGYAFAGWPMRQLIGDMSKPYNSWELLITGKPQQAFFSYREVAITLRDRLQDFGQPVQTTKYLGNNVLPNGLEGLTDIKDRPKPLLYGRAQNLSPILVNTAKLIYQVNDGPIEDLTAVYDKGVALSRGWPDYTDDTDMQANQPAAGTYRAWLAGGYFRLGAMPSGTITCDAADRVATNDNTAARVALRIAARPPLTGEGGITDADIVWSDVSELDRKNPATVGIWIADETQFSAALDAVLGSIGAWYGFDRYAHFRMQRHEVPQGQGVVTFRRFGPDVDAALGEYDIIDLRFLPTNDPDKGVPSYEVSLDYGVNYTVQPADGLAGDVSTDRRNFLALATRTAVSSNTSVQTAYPLAIQKKLSTLLLNQPDALAEATRVLQMYNIQRDFIEIDTPLLSDLSAMIDIGSEIRVVLPRFNYAGGKPMRITGMQYNALGRVLTIAAWG